MADGIKTEVRETQATLYLTKGEIEQIVSDALKSAFRDLGLASQYDSFESVKEFRADLQFLRDWRTMCELMRHRGVITGVTLIMGAFFTVVILGVRSWILG